LPPKKNWKLSPAVEATLHYGASNFRGEAAFARPPNPSRALRGEEIYFKNTPPVLGGVG